MKGLFLLFTCFFLSNALNSKTFYIYEWSQDIVHRWPSGFTHFRLAMNFNNSLNYGVGAVLDAKYGIFDTHQYSLFRVMFYRLLESPNRTLDPSKASMFFIPYDLGLDSSCRLSDGALIRTYCPKMTKVIDLLEKSSYFKRNNGSDHFIIHSINQPMTYFATISCMKLYNICINCLKLSIDVYKKDMFRVISDHYFLQNRWVSIPFPSSYHWHPFLKYNPWDSQFEHTRKYLISFMGTYKVTARFQRLLRKSLIDECGKRPLCLYSNTKHHDSLHEIDQMLLIPYRSSLFCLMPGGDFPTRKGFVDSLLSGCIPVVFQLEAAHNQWPWHWHFLDDVSPYHCILFFPWREVIENISSFFDQLEAIGADKTRVLSLQKNISRIAPFFRYNAPSGFSTPVISPFDAVDVVLKNIL